MGWSRRWRRGVGRTRRRRKWSSPLRHVHHLVTRSTISYNAAGPSLLSSADTPSPSPCVDPAVSKLSSRWQALPPLPLPFTRLVSVFLFHHHLLLLSLSSLQLFSHSSILDETRCPCTSCYQLLSPIALLAVTQSSPDHQTLAATRFFFSFAFTTKHPTFTL